MEQVKRQLFLMPINKYFQLPLLIVVLLLGGCDNDNDIISNSNTTPSYQPNQLTLAVLPYMSPPHILDTFEPLATYLSAKTKIPMRIKTSVDFEKFVQQTLLHRYDLVISNPYLYLKLHKQGNYEPLVADTNPFQTVFVTLKLSKIQSIKDVKGKRIGVLPKGALAGYVLPLDYLHQKGMRENKDLTLVEYNTFDLILTALLDNKIDVGCFWLPYLELISDKTQNKTRTFAVTTKFVLDPYSVRKDLPENLKQKLRKAFIELNYDNEEQKQILKRTGARGFALVKDSDYNEMREFAKRNKLEY